MWMQTSFSFGGFSSQTVKSKLGVLVLKSCQVGTGAVHHLLKTNKIIIYKNVGIHVGIFLIINAIIEIEQRTSGPCMLHILAAIASIFSDKETNDKHSNRS